MAVPGSYNDQGEDTALRDHYGWAFYQKMVTLPALCAGQRVVLRFGAVTHKAKVWLDGPPHRRAHPAASCPLRPTSPACWPPAPPPA